MLRIVIPKGSLEEATFKLFEQANLPIKRNSNRGYKLRINDPRITETMILRPQEIPKYIEEGEFDIGITGYDWITETESVVKEVADLLKEKNYRAIVEQVFEPDINIQKAVDNWEPIDLTNLDKWTDKMLGDCMDNLFFRHSMFDNYLVEAME